MKRGKGKVTKLGKAVQRMRANLKAQRGSGLGAS